MFWRYWQGVLRGISALFDTIDRRRAEGVPTPLIFNLDGIPKVEVVIEPDGDVVSDDDPGYEIPIEDLPSPDELTAPISELR
jgi:hypothetical protein